VCDIMASSIAAEHYSETRLPSHATQLMNVQGLAPCQTQHNATVIDATTVQFCVVYICLGYFNPQVISSLLCCQKASVLPGVGVNNSTVGPF
jgi:hypothetical protein